MASITIRNLDEDVKRRLRLRAGDHGRSLEEEVRAILRGAVSPPSVRRNLGHAIHARFEEARGVCLAPVERGPMRRTHDFD